MANNNDNNPLSSPKNNVITVKKKESTKQIGDYYFGETIGQGAFAKVKLATHIYTQEKVAIKILNKSKLIENTKDISRFQKEIYILKRIRHNNIIQLYEIMESNSSLYIVMDYCEGKELFDYIIKRKQLTEREACRFFQQIINGVEYLHLQNITHRDLKPENLLLDNKKRIKISDFGLSSVNDKENILLKTPCGTPSYAPPEMLRGDEYCGTKSDIWSCGIILYTMLCGNLPCAESKEELIYQCFYNKTYDYPSYISPIAKDLIEKLLRFNPDDRLTFEQIKRHPWFNLIRPELTLGIIVGTHKIPIDDNILNKLERFGYDKEKCRESVSMNKNDPLCSVYYLIMKQLDREGKHSISDMHSDEYNNYIQNSENWEHPDKLKENKYKDYWPGKGLSAANVKIIDALLSPRYKIKDDDEEEDNQYDIDDRLIMRTDVFENEPLITNLSRKFDEESINKSFNTSSINSVSNNNNDTKFTLKTIGNNEIQREPIPKQITYTASSRKNNKICNFFTQTTQGKIIQRSPYANHTYKNYQSNHLESVHNQITLFKSESDFLPTMDRYKEPPMEESKKKALIDKLINSQSTFDSDMKYIDTYSSYHSLSLGNETNPLKSIAKKLLKTTIFSRYLLNKKYIKEYKDELEQKFYTLQKYKELVEIIKSTKIGIFPKKIYDWNYCTFDAFLNNEEDYIFNDNFNKSNINKGFVNMLKSSIKKNNKKDNLKRYLSKNLTTIHLTSGLKNNYSTGRKSYYSASGRHKRINKFFIVPSNLFIHDYSVDRSNSKQYKSARKGSNDSGGCYPRALFKSKFSTSTMNDISEDEELFEIKRTPMKNLGSYNKEASPRRITVTKSKEPFDKNPYNKPLTNYKAKTNTKSKSLNQKIIAYTANKQMSPLIIDQSFNDTVSSLNSYQTQSSINKQSNILVFPSRLSNNLSPKTPNIITVSKYINTHHSHSKDNRIKQFTATIQKRAHPIYINPSNSSTMTNHTNNSDDREYYSGPIDFRCVFSSSKEIIIPIIKQYFKQNDYFCNVTCNNTIIKCSKANTHIELELMKLKSSIPSLIYIKSKKKNGEIAEYSKIMTGLLNSLDF